METLMLLLLLLLLLLLIFLGSPFFKLFQLRFNLSLRYTTIKKPILPSLSCSKYNKLPPSYPFIGCLVSFYKNRSRLLDWYTELLSESPTQTIVISRFGARRTVVTANPSNVEYILKTNFPNFPKGKPFTVILGDFLGRGIFNADGDQWTVQRKLASHEFSASSLRDFVVKTLETEVETRLLPLLEEASNQNRTLDLQDVLRRFAFDTVCHVSLGIDPCCLDMSSGVAPALVTAFDDASRICAMRGMAPVFLVWKMKRAFNLGSERELKQAVQLVHEAVRDIIHDRKKKNTSISQQGNDGTMPSKCDLLSRLLEAGLEDEMVRDMVVSFIMAGRDTTSSAMTWLFWLLSYHPQVEEMAISEARSTKNGILNFEALKEMNYIKACLCESMRLYPPVAWDSKHAAADDVLPDGTPVRRGDRVTYFPYGMGRMEDLWGKDRFEFRPDRWVLEPAILGDNDHHNQLKVVSPYKFPVFQAGPRVCLGKEMAFIQMKYVVASILRRFEIRRVSDDRPVFVPLLTAHMAGGLMVKVRKRSQQCP